jgi:RNA polymerase sigma-70 factor (ECF subfamily)
MNAHDQLQRWSNHLAAAPPMTGGAPPNGAPPIGAEGPDQDAALILSIAARRDRAAFATLFGRFGPRLKSWFIRTGCPAEQAEDLVQDTMLAVWRKAESFNPAQAGVATWIFAIARNRRIDAWRRTPRQTLDEDDPSLAPPEPESPDAVLDMVERDNRLRVALRDLPAEQMDVIRLSFFEDRPHAEIEQTLGIPLGTVKSRLRLAMRRLRAHLGDQIPPRTGRDGVSS